MHIKREKTNSLKLKHTHSLSSSWEQKTALAIAFLHLAALCSRVQWSTSIALTALIKIKAVSARRQ